METMTAQEAINPVKESVRVDVEIGRVMVRTHDKPLVDVVVEYRDMDVTVGREGSSVVVRAEKRAGMARWWPGRSPKAEVTVHMPADCPLKVRVVTGRVDICDVVAPVQSTVVTGSTRLANLGQQVDARSTTGSIEYDGVLADDRHHFRTTTGRLRLRLHKEPNAWFDAKTVTGHVHSDFPLAKEENQRLLVGGRLRGMLGSGTGQIQARVVTGHIHLERA